MQELRKTEHVFLRPNGRVVDVFAPYVSENYAVTCAFHVAVL